MTERNGLQEFLRMESFWHRSFVGPDIRSQIKWTAVWLVTASVASVAIWWLVLTVVSTPTVIGYSIAVSIVSTLAIVMLLTSLTPAPEQRHEDIEDITAKDVSTSREALQFATLFDCPEPPTILFEAQCNEWIPSVFQRGDGSYALAVPAGLLLRDPAERRALVAHEIAHVAQDDVGLWLVADQVATAIRHVSWLMIGFLLCSIAVSALLGSGIGPGAAIVGRDIVIWIRLSRVRRRVKRYRHYAEIRADFAAVAFADGDALHRALLAISISSSDIVNSDNHPDIHERMMLVADATRYWESSGQPTTSAS
jgi:hypothetical protein